MENMFDLLKEEQEVSSAVLIVIGLMEFAGVHKAERSKLGVWKMQEWTYRHYMARVDIAGVDNAAPLWQGWTMQEEKTCPS